MGYIGAGLTRFNTADELTVTGDAEIGGIATVDALKLSETDVLLSAGETAIITSSNDVQIIRDGSIKLTATATGVDVTGTVTADGLTVDGGGTNFPITVTSTDQYAGITFVDNTTTSSAVVAIYADGDELGFEAGNAERMRIDSGGNVGIGTTSPASKLHVNGSFRQTGATAPFEWTVNAGATDYYKLNSVGYSDNIIVATATGNVGIGCTPIIPLEVLANSGANALSLRTRTNNDYSFLTFRSNDGTEDLGGLSVHRTAASTGALRFYTANGGAATEKLRIDSSGRVIINDTSSGGDSLTVYGKIIGSDQYGIQIRGNANGYNQTAVRFFDSYNTNIVGSITFGTGGTAYNTTSDYRLKENVTADWDATTRLKQLNPVRFNFITDADTTVDGFLAHEVQDIVPEAISGTKDAMRDEEYQVSAATGDIYTPAVAATYDEDGVELTAAIDEVIHSADVERPEELAEGQQWRETTAAVMGTRSVPDYQGIDQSKLVPLLVKTIQELEARIAALETA